MSEEVYTADLEQNWVNGRDIITMIVIIIIIIVKHFSKTKLQSSVQEKTNKHNDTKKNQKKNR